MSSCYICDKHRGKIEVFGEVYKDDILAVYHLEPKENKVYLGYLFIELKRHIKGLEDMNDDEACAVGRMLQKISRLLKDNYNVEHIYSHVIGDNVPHLHIHIVPRYKDAPREFWGLKTDEWENAPHGDKSRVQEYCSKLKKQLE